MQSQQDRSSVRNVVCDVNDIFGTQVDTGKLAYCDVIQAVNGPSVSDDNGVWTSQMVFIKTLFVPYSYCLI